MPALSTVKTILATSALVIVTICLLNHSVPTEDERPTSQQNLVLIQNFVYVPRDTKVQDTNATPRLTNASMDAVTCKFPRLDPWDESLRPYIRHPRSHNCSRVQTDDLVYLDDLGYLHLNYSARSIYEQSSNAYVECACSFVDKKEGTDEGNGMYPSSYTKSESLRLMPNKPEAMRTDIAEVICTDENKNQIYYNLFAHPSNETIKDKVLLGNTENQLSVLMFVLESTSLSVMRRNLPRTYDYLTKVMGAFVFKGYTKVSDNSFHNLIPLLVGKRTRDEQPDMPSEVDKVTEIFFDDWDIIWKKFANRSYVTVFNEDRADVGLFHFYTKGFLNKPTDHYYHPFWRMLRLSGLRHKSTEYCYGNKPKVSYQIDILRRQLMKYSGIRQFIYSFFCDLSHDFANDLERGDDIFYEFFRTMYENGYLNHTVVFFMGDHGHRSDPLRQTVVGLIEERMPGLTITFPRWFLDLNPNIARHLQENQLKLSSNFDVHETLLDIVYANYAGEQRTNGSRALSHIYPIPANRTCAQAGIPEFFCVCEEAVWVNVSGSNVVTGAALAVVDHINSMLQVYADRCVNLTLAKTLHAEALSVNKMVVKGVRKFKDIKKHEADLSAVSDGEIKSLRIAIKVQPSDATFETIVQVNNAALGDYSVTDNISRTNRYGNQSACVHDLELRKYCFCMNYKASADT